MRGIRNSKLFVCTRIGNIPAYAGNTHRLGGLHCQCKEHPRVCGEYDETLEAIYDGIGTSPRMRGIRIRRKKSLEGVRNIPAYAGNTLTIHR